MTEENYAPEGLRRCHAGGCIGQTAAQNCMKEAPDQLSASWRSVLERNCGKHLFEARSVIKGAGCTRGFIVDFSDDLILFHVLGADTFRLNGYTVIRSDNVKDYRSFDRRAFWENRAVCHFKLKPVRPAGILLMSIPALLTSASKRYPLVTIHREKTRPEVCHIGALFSMTEATFTMDDLDCNAKWTGPRRLKFSDVTRIDFGGGYEEALALTAPKRLKRRSLGRSLSGPAAGRGA
jgi:hypothetical protein